VKAVIRALLAAKDPLLHVGEGVCYADAAAELLQFAEAAQIPVLTTLKAKGVFPENHPLSVGVRGSMADHFLRKCDLLFSIGSSLFPGRFSHTVPDAHKKTIVQCTVDTLDINRSYETRHAVVGDARLTLQALISELEAKGPMKRPEVLEEIRGQRQVFKDKFRPWLESDETPINPYRVFGDLAKVLDPRSSFLTADSGNTRDQTSTVYEAQIPRGYLGWGKSHALGTGLGLTIGAKLAAPDKLCVNFMGDAAFGMTGLDFETAVRCGIPILTVVLNNSAMAIEIPHLVVSHDKYGTRDIGGRYADLGRAMGGWSERVERPEDIAGAFARARKATEDGQAALLEFITSQETRFSHRGALR